MTKKNNQHGYTMIETILYISLLIILGGILTGYAHNVIRRYRIGRVAQQVIELKKAILQYTAVNEDYTALDINKMIEKDALPLDMRSQRHALGGAVSLGAVSDLPGVPQNDNYRYLFYIRFDNLFRGACTELLTQGQFYGDGSDLDTLIVNNDHAWKYKHSYFDDTPTEGTNILEPDISTATPDLMSAPNIRLTISEALDACHKKDNNHIIWIFS